MNYLAQVTADNSGRVDSIMLQAENLTKKVDVMTDDLEYMAAAARDFADRLNYGDGTLQLLVDDRRLYDDLRKAADNLDDLIIDIKENPKKYLQLKVELF